MITIEQILLDAAALVRKGWTTGAYARDAAGEWTVSTDPHAVCWCADGAILAASKLADQATRNKAHDRFHALFPNDGESRSGGRIRGPVYFNDYVAKSAEEVAQALEKAASSS